jgi:hypothetical protein
MTAVLHCGNSCNFLVISYTKRAQNNKKLLLKNTESHHLILGAVEKNRAEGRNIVYIDFYVHSNYNSTKAMPQLKWLVAGFPPRRPEFKPGSGHVGFVVDKVALGQVFSK